MGTPGRNTGSSKHEGANIIEKQLLRSEDD